MNKLIGRMRGLATVHGLPSATEWAPVRLSDLANQVIRSSLQALPQDKQIFVDVFPSRVLVTPDESHNLALMINELATDGAKYASGERRAA